MYYVKSNRNLRVFGVFKQKTGQNIVHQVKINTNVTLCRVIKVKIGHNFGVKAREMMLICVCVFVYFAETWKQVVSVEEHWVKPRSADINENVLSELAKDELGLSEEQIRKGNSLEHVIAKVFYHSPSSTSITKSISLID